MDVTTNRYPLYRFSPVVSLARFRTEAGIQHATVGMDGADMTDDAKKIMLELAPGVAVTVIKQRNDSIVPDRDLPSPSDSNSNIFTAIILTLVVTRSLPCFHSFRL